VAYHRHFGHLTTSLKSLKSRVYKGGQSRSKSKEPLLANKHKQTPTKAFPSIHSLPTTAATAPVEPKCHPSAVRR
jgi:hypothetical protein